MTSKRNSLRPCEHGAAGPSHDNQRTPNVHISITERPQRGKKRTNFAAGEGKKKGEILGGLAEGVGVVRVGVVRGWSGGGAPKGGDESGFGMRVVLG